MNHILRAQNIFAMIEGPPLAGKSFLLAVLLRMSQVMEYPCTMYASSNANNDLVVNIFHNQFKPAKVIRYHHPIIEVDMVLRAFSHLHDATDLSLPQSATQ